MTGVEWKVAVDGGEVTARYEPAEGAQRGVFVCAHGAGGSMMDRGTAAAANLYRSIGLGVVRFNFLYKERGSGRPDPMPILEACVAGVVARTRAEIDPAVLLIGGRSMGGRVSSMLAARGFDADGLILLAYPLHPAGQPEKLRDAHLAAIGIPTLILNGTRDELCRPQLMEAALARADNPRLTMHWLEGADHSFHVLKSSGRNDAAVLAEVAQASTAWLQSIC